MSDIYSRKWFEENKILLSNAYFDKDPKVFGDAEKELLKLLGIKQLNNEISKQFEEDIIEKCYLENGLINKTVVAWKAGRLDKHGDTFKIQKSKTNNYLNGYGNEINKFDLEKYLDIVEKRWKNLDKDYTDFERIYSLFVPSDKKDESIKVPNNFGSVYIINLIYFLSGKKWPIYDQFAHKALKALDRGISPSKIWIGSSPEKHEKRKVVNMYMEYCYLLEKIFYNKEISRDLDRALWVYGHAHT